MPGIWEPRRIKGSGWLAAGLLAGVFVGTAPAQDEPPPADQETPATDAATSRSPAVEDLPVNPVIWPEPRRDELLRNEFKELPGGIMGDRDRNAMTASIMEMARGRGLDRPLVKKYVDYYLAELTKHSNIAAMMGTEGAGRNPRALDEAADQLLQPLLEPSAPNNQSFRREYVTQLLSHADDLLNGHLLSRTFYMVVLSRAGGVDVVPTLIEQLRDPQQAYMVKLLAAVGLTAASEGGRRPLDANSQSVPAARALADFLRNAPDAPAPVQIRCLEAMGALRQATENPLSGEAELAGAAFEYLANEQVDPLVRAWAGRTLSRMVYPIQLRGLNLDVVAYELGRAALVAGERIAALPVADAEATKNLKLVERWTEPLLRGLEAFIGDDTLRSTGLNNLGSGTPLGRGVEQRIRALSKVAIQYYQAVGAQVKPAQREVQSAVDELRIYLNQNPPRSAEFYSGGPTAELPATGAEAAPAPAAATSTSGAR